MISIARPEHRGLLQSALVGILLPAIVTIPIGLLGMSALGLSSLFLVKSLAVLGGGAALILWGLPGRHPFPSIGAANRATIARGTLIALLVGLLGEHVSVVGQFIATVTAAIAASLDGIDGWLARSRNTASDFGARFDMETDAVLILALAALAWQFDKAGAWVLVSGALRYAFIAAGLFLPWMRAPLPARFRRKAIAVIQTIALIVAILPSVVPDYSALIAGLALFMLALSFALDIRWLLRYAAQPRTIATEQ